MPRKRQASEIERGTGKMCNKHLGKNIYLSREEMVRDTAARSLHYLKEEAEKETDKKA